MTTTERYRTAWLSARRRAAGAARTRASHATPLDELGFSTRTYNALRLDGIATVGDLIGRSAENLMDLRYFGPGALREVHRVLAGRGESLAPWTGGAA